MQSWALTEHAELHGFAPCLADGVCNRTAVHANVFLLHWVDEEGGVVLGECETLPRTDRFVIFKPLLLSLGPILHNAGQSNIVLFFHKRTL